MALDTHFSAAKHPEVQVERPEPFMRALEEEVSCLSLTQKPPLYLRMVHINTDESTRCCLKHQLMKWTSATFKVLLFGAKLNIVMIHCLLKFLCSFWSSYFIDTILQWTSKLLVLGPSQFDPFFGLVLSSLTFSNTNLCPQSHWSLSFSYPWPIVSWSYWKWCQRPNQVNSYIQY